MAKKNKKQQKGQQKAVQKRKDKALADATFGMKNKKSKKAKAMIKNLHNQYKGNQRQVGRDGMTDKERRRMKKLEEKERERELKKLFGDTKKRDQFAHEDEADTAEAVMDLIEDDLEEEMEMTLEDIIEKERAKILEGTPVTEESFAKWKAFKDAQKKKEEENVKKNRVKMFKNTGGKGLSGRELYEMNIKMFVDDKEASQKQEYAIDEDLFLDSDDEDEEEGTQQDDSYDPSTWKQDKKPKQLLQELHTSKKIPQAQWPKYDLRKPEQKVVGRVYFSTCTLPAFENKAFICDDMHSKKKDAENAVAWLAYKWAVDQEPSS